MKLRLTTLACVGILCLQCSKKSINLDELTVSNIHRSFTDGEYSSEDLVRAYIDRIEKYDQAKEINSIILINPSALSEAKKLDEEFKETGELRPLHGIPLIVKDNYITEGIQTTGGSIALKGFIPKSNAYQVQKLLDAGAIVLAKSNMAEWAFSAMHTEGSLVGTTRNPYNRNHVPAGSSGGTGAAIASNFGTLGLGTDTGNSIRGPSSHNSLVGFRSTLGLTSREGIIPLYLRNDVGGPMCRTVEDATKVLQAISGYDPKDPITKYSEGKLPENYVQFLDINGLEGSKIGVLRELTQDIAPEIEEIFEQAIRDLERLGAHVIDSFKVQNFDSLRQGQWCNNFGADVNQFLATYGNEGTVKDINEIIKIGGFSEFVEDRLERAVSMPGRRDESEYPCEDVYTDIKRIAFREAIENEMNRLGVDALIYPSWNYPPALIDEFQEGYKGDNSQIIAPHTGQPAFSIPMGFTDEGLPTGIQFLGKMYDESTLIKLTYGYEQGTLHRRGPKMN